MNSLSLFHLVREPGISQTGPPPLLILLHGVGSNEQDLMGLAPALDPQLFIVSARAPITRGNAAYAWFSIEFVPDGILINPDEAEASRQKLLRFVDELIHTYKVDAKRVYLMGFSQGCIMSLYCALTEPGRFAGVVGMSGRLLPDTMSKLAAPEELDGFPLMIVHGTEDTVLPIQYGRGIQSQLSALPVDLTYREYPMGHHVSVESMRDIARWLNEQLDRTSS